MKQFQIKINDGKVLLNLATIARGKVVSPPCAPMSTMLHDSGSNSWERLLEDFDDYEEVGGNEDDLEEDYEDEDDLEQGDPGV